MPMSVSDDALAAAREAELEEALRRALRNLSQAKAKTEDLVEAVYRAVGDSLLAHPPAKVPEPKLARGRGKAEVALWHLTDWQGSKVTASYNTQVMQERVAFFCKKAERITNIH